MSNTLWAPRIKKSDGPIYRAIADALERDVSSGLLRDGARLPTHRELAGALGVTPLTITRAYREAATRGLIDSTVGRGTFVRTLREPSRQSEATRFVDLSRNIIEGHDSIDLGRSFGHDFAELVQDAEYHPAEGLLRHRTAASRWLERANITAEPEQILITPGAQQAVLAILGALCSPGDTIFAEALSYPRMASIAAFLHLKVQPLPVDEQGLIPRYLDRACRSAWAKALYLIPNFQNPTGSVMPEKRRREIAAIARRNSLPIIEDDVYGFLSEEPLTPISALAPELGCYVTSASKSLSPSLRLGFATIPPALLERVHAAFASTTAFTSTLSGETFALMLESGSADRTVAAKRMLVRTNRRIAERVLGPDLPQADPASPHLWMQLPPTCDARDLVERARQRGLGVSPASAFAFDRRDLPNAIRISLGATSDARQLENALHLLQTLIANPRVGSGTVV